MVLERTLESPLDCKKIQPVHEKKAISLLSKLRNELQTDKPIVPLVEKFVDTDIWNQYLEYQQSLLNESDGKPRWFLSPWLFVECYMYRRIHEAIIQR